MPSKTRWGWNDRHKAYAALRATLHALRDRLPINEAAQFSAQLPLIVRGLYWEGWRPSAGEAPHDTFLGEIRASFKHDLEINPEQVARAVFEALANEISHGEMEDVRSTLPGDIRSLLPSPDRNHPRMRTKPERVVPASGDVSAAHWGA